MTTYIDETDDVDEFFGIVGRSRPAASTTPKRTAPKAKPSGASKARPSGASRPRSRSSEVSRPRTTSAGAPTRRRTPGRRSSVPSRSAARPSAPRRVIAPVSDEVLAARARRRRIAFLAVPVLLVVAVVAKLIDVQATQRAFWVDRGETARGVRRTLPAPRGVFYDRNGQILAMSVSRPNVVVDPVEISKVLAKPADRTKAAELLAPAIGIPPAEVLAKFDRKGSRYEILARNVTPAVEDAVRALVVAKRVQGVSLEATYVRSYPAGEIAPALVGRTFQHGVVDGSGRQGGYGLERSLDDVLKGVPGKVTFQQARGGGQIADTVDETVAARAGDDVHLTIDAALQYATQQALVRQVEATGAAEAMAIITRPSTGEVLAMASVADVDGTVGPTKDDRPASVVFEPGSVNKMITVAGAVEDGLVRPDTVIDVPDHLQLYDHTFTDHDPHPVRPWSVTDVIVTSSNIGTIKIAQRLGKDRVDHYLRAFGLGHRTGDQIPGEVNGLMLDPDQWSGTSIGAIPIGQGISVTALQMLSAYNVVATGGLWVQPRVLSRVGQRPVAAGPASGRRVISESTAGVMREMLAKVVADGTGKKAAIAGYVAYGKTGTARIPQEHPTDPSDAYRNEKGGYDYQSTFLGGVEGADLTAIVTIRQPRTSIYGGDVAAPVFSELSMLALRRLGVPPTVPAGPVGADVPQLSSTARGLDGEGPPSRALTKQG